MAECEELRKENIVLRQRLDDEVTFSRRLLEIYVKAHLRAAIAEEKANG